MLLDQWAKRWNISEQAITDLKKNIGTICISSGMDACQLSEGGVQSRVRLEASQKGARLWRNNVGATYTPDGAFIRYGLANESSGVNKQIKSADLIGIRPIKIIPEMVGMVIGQFMSREIKKANWRYTGNERELAQLKWAELILSLGGDACFAIGEGTI
jgi:hypothetical protein